jgi:hypothetical protein
MWSAWCARCHGQDGSGKVSQPTIRHESLKVATPIKVTVKDGETATIDVTMTR